MNRLPYLPWLPPIVTLPVSPIFTPFFKTTFTIPPLPEASYFAEGVRNISILVLC